MYNKSFNKQAKIRLNKNFNFRFFTLPIYGYLILLLIHEYLFKKFKEIKILN